jgi:hypothetical protein
LAAGASHINSNGAVRPLAFEQDNGTEQVRAEAKPARTGTAIDWGILVKEHVDSHMLDQLCRR